MSLPHVCRCGVCGQSWWPLAATPSRPGVGAGIVLEMREVESDRHDMERIDYNVTVAPLQSEHFWILPEELVEREARQDFMHAAGMV